MRFLALGLLFVATPAFAADQFDLICTAGTEVQHYRIDLAANEWCFGKCEMVQKIASVTSGLITLMDHPPQYPRDWTGYNRINRLTGEWQWYNYDPRYPSIQDVKGKCDPGVFSGLPVRKF